MLWDVRAQSLGNSIANIAKVITNRYLGNPIQQIHTEQRSQRRFIAIHDMGMHVHLCTP